MYTAFASGLRKEIADGFHAEDSVVRVIVATVAFGMGIDCMGVRQVIHVTCPETPEAMPKKLVDVDGMVNILKQLCLGSWPLPQVQPCGSIVGISTVTEVHSLMTSLTSMQ